MVRGAVLRKTGKATAEKRGFRRGDSQSKCDPGRRSSACPAKEKTEL